MSALEQAPGGLAIEVVAKATRRRFTVEFSWYNTEHRHSGLGPLTPADVHHGLAEQRVAARATVLATASAAHPERFPRGLPRPPACPTQVDQSTQTLVRSPESSNTKPLVPPLPARISWRSLAPIIAR